MGVFVRNGIVAIALAMALGLLRLSAMSGLDLTFVRAWQIGLSWGLVGDLAFALMPLSFGILVGSVSRRAATAVYASLAIILWVATLTNLSYYKSFKVQVDLWMLVRGSESLWSIRQFVVNSVSNPWTITSAICLAASIVVFKRTRSEKGPMRLTPMARRAFGGVLLFTFALLLRETPAWMHFPTVLNSVMSDCVVHRWAKQWSEQGLAAFDHLSHPNVPAAEAAQLLNAFALSSGDDIGEKVLQSPTLPDGMMRAFEPSPAETAALRKQLGFPLDKKLNIVLLFLESTRAFEFYHPDIGPRIFPNLHKLLREHGILFRQTYSSATITVEGQFASLCSALNRQNGSAVYSSRPFLQVRCIQKLFAEHGYERYWMNPYQKHYSGKYLFESRQKMDHFYDEHEFFPHSEDEAANSTEWGLGDVPFYRQAFAKLEHIHAEGKPFFVHVLNTGTHGPWNRNWKGFELPKDLEEKTRANPEYNGYLKSFVGLDTALGEFFSKFFASPMSNDTVVIIVSDHGQSIEPSHLRLSRHQRRLLIPRIIFGVVSKNMQRPEEVPYPVSQLDVAPLIGVIANLRGEVAWIGRNPLQNRGGTPWVARFGDQLGYRTRKSLCLLRTEASRSACWKVPEILDPLFSEDLEVDQESTSLAHLFSQVIDANESLIESDSLLAYPSNSRRRPSASIDDLQTVQ